MRNLFQRIGRGQEGFTLIELMVVVAIIGLLAAFAVPRLFEAISDAKRAPGQVDLNTISAGLERFYFAENEYPLDDTVVADLVPKYLKSTTTWRNGFKKNFIYGTSADGKGYILIDPANEDSITLTCHNAAIAVQSGNDAPTTVVVTSPDDLPTCAVSNPGENVKWVNN